MQMDRYALTAGIALRQDLGAAAGTDAASLVTTGASLVAIHNWTFLLGQTLMPGVNALLLGYLMYRSRLVPRVIPVLGLIGAPLLITATIATLFGLNEQVSVWSAIATLPVAVWELSLGVWLVVKGFKPSPITAGMVAAQYSGDRSARTLTQSAGCHTMATDQLLLAGRPARRVAGPPQSVSPAISSRAHHNPLTPGR